MLLENKNAVIYGGGGAIGGAVARAFAREGAKAHLAGHTLTRLEEDYYLGGLQVPFEAIESMRRQLSAELGSHGVRVVTLRTGGVPETIPEGFDGREAIVEGIERLTLLGRAATLEDVGNAAVFAASDWARTLTATTVNISCGALID